MIFFINNKKNNLFLAQPKYLNMPSRKAGITSRDRVRSAQKHKDEKALCGKKLSRKEQRERAVTKSKKKKDRCE